MPSFGAAEDLPAEFAAPDEDDPPAVQEDELFVAASADRDVQVEDELSFAAPLDKVQEVTEQITEFLINFSHMEQKEILAPFLCVEAPLFDEDVEPHIDEARRFIRNFLQIYPKEEQNVILETWRRGDSATTTPPGSCTPRSLSVTPPGCVTPTGSVTPQAVTPREFLSARRQLAEMQSPA